MYKQLTSRFGAWIIAALFLTITSFAYASEYARTTQDTEAREIPDDKSRVVMSISANLIVNVIEKKPEWVAIEVAKKRGWIPASHIYSVARESAAPKSGFLSWFSAVLQQTNSRASTGRSASSLATATAGIRGLGEDGANAARFHSEALQALKLYAISSSDAEEFAISGNLTSTRIAYLEPSP